MFAFLKKLFTFQNLITLLTVALFFVPIIVSSFSAYPFIFPKALFLQAVTALLLGVYAIALLFGFKNYYPRRSWLGLSVLVFYIVIFISALKGVDFNRSVWDRAERMLGLFTMVHYGALFLIWRSMFTKERYLALWKTFVVIGCIPLGIALYQLVNPAFLFNLGAQRVASTLGNPIYTAGFALFIFFSAIFFAYTAGGKKNRIAWFIVMALSFATLFATQTRGALIAWWVGLGMLAIGRYALRDTRYAIRDTREAMNQGVPVILSRSEGSKSLSSNSKKHLIASLAFLVFVPLCFLALRNVSIVQKIPGVGKLFSTPLEESTGGTRLIFWQVAVNGWRDRPLLGWGWGNFYDLANKHYDPQLLKYGAGEEWVDNAHNIIVNTLATSGVLGLLAFLSIYVAAGYALLKKYKGGTRLEKALAITLGIIFTVDLVRNLFIFEDITSYLFFFWLLAGVDIWCSDTSVNRQMQFSLPRICTFWPIRIFGYLVRSAVVLAVCVGLYALVRNFVYMPGRADYLQAQAIQAAGTDFGKAIRYHGQAISVRPNPYAPELSFDFGQFFVVWLGNHQDFVFSDYRKLAFDMYGLGTDALNSYLSHYPADVRAGSVLARAYQDGYDFWQSPAYLNKAEDEYKKMLQFSPRRQTLLMGLGRTKLLQNKIDEALPLFVQARDEAVAVATPHWYLALVYIQKKDSGKAIAEAREAIKYNYAFSMSDLLVAHDLFKEQNAVGELAPKMRQYIFSSSKPDGRVVQAYVEYLQKAGDTAGLAEVQKLVGGS